MKENSIEEDIKRINNFITYFNKNIQNGNKADLTVLGEEINAIEHILSDYKRVLKENEELKHITQNYNAYQQKSDNPNTTIIIADEKWFINGYFKENFIPKSKVKEKIEELKNGTYDAKIILQQLLED